MQVWGVERGQGGKLRRSQGKGKARGRVGGREMRIGDGFGLERGVERMGRVR